MELFLIILLSVVAYLLGSIPTSVWISKAYFGFDIRGHGSGNAGATNTFRVLGKQVGTVVLFMDVIKGVTAASLVHYLGGIEHGTDRFINLQLLF